MFGIKVTVSMKRKFIYNTINLITGIGDNGKTVNYYFSLY